ncbi:hypothetical protein K9U40_21695 [Xanthobacter autotrophicus]|uniref:hypothetical protein n=1 Tax=Xanthobacter TaxID=279 RepID=UPI0024AB8D08|nr:hypothetical protein [Xanthobacter autotrophicus]MDI4666914.1 hypothetical protein [Xanthobacter autotrophicus]
MNQNHTYDANMATADHRPLDRAQLLDYLAQRGVRITVDEAALPMPDLMKIALERLAALQDHMSGAEARGGFLH